MMVNKPAQTTVLPAADHVTGMAADNRRSKDLILAFFDVNLYKPSGLPINDGPVHTVKGPADGRVFNPAFFQMT
jgi:hypothetical protein